MQFALIKDGLVTQIIIAPDGSPNGFPASIGLAGQWVPGNEAQVGWTYSGGKFAEPVVPDDPVTIDDAKAGKLSDINAAFEQAASALTTGYPEAERLTWPTQQAEALAWAADGNTPTPYLDGIAAARGIEPAMMRQMTLVQVQAFQSASQYLVGTRQRLRDAISAADTIEAVQSIGWPK